jgi:hypothetical protein
VAKRRVFISYHHHGDQDAVDAFSRAYCDTYDVFTDRSLERAADSTDVDYLNQVCRDAIDGTSVTIVMLGLQSHLRKFIDWEIRYSLFREHGVMGIVRPGLSSFQVTLPARLADNVRTGYARWYEYPRDPESLRLMIENAYMANKALIDNSRPKMGRNL